MDFLTAAVLIVLITGATVVLVVKVLASTPARIAAVLGAVAVLFGVLPRLIAPLSPTPSTPMPTSTVTVAPDGFGGVEQTPPAEPAVPPSDATSTGGVF
ncbi:hypothetical protein ACWEQH_01370 [Streptomyces sp. NPDC004166]